MKGQIRPDRPAKTRQPKIGRHIEAQAIGRDNINGPHVTEQATGRFSSVAPISAVYGETAKAYHAREPAKESEHGRPKTSVVFKNAIKSFAPSFLHFRRRLVFCLWILPFSGPRFLDLRRASTWPECPNGKTQDHGANSQDPFHPRGTQSQRPKPECDSPSSLQSVLLEIPRKTDTDGDQQDEGDRRQNQK